MARFMHIVSDVEAEKNARGDGYPRAYCGKTLRPGKGAAAGAALCPTCRRKAGWTRDRRWW